MDELELIYPSLDMKEDILQYKEEHFKYGDMQVHGTGGLAYYDDLDEWLEHIETIRKGNLDAGIKTSTFFSRRVSDGKLIGCVKLHHSLNEELKNGGHIASAKTAIGCGGISVKEFEEDGVMKQHYLIELKGI